MKRIFFTVTNALAYDQRMIRICTSLTRAGYEVTLVGWKFDSSISLAKQPYIQKRLPCVFSQGKPLYVEYNNRLFLLLHFRRMHCICAIDLDTNVQCYLISIVKRIPRF